MNPSRVLLFGLFAGAAFLADALLLAQVETVSNSSQSVWTALIIGSAMGQIGLLSIFLAWGPHGLFVRLALTLAGLWLCSAVAARADEATISAWFWFCLIYLICAVLPLFMARRLKEDYFQNSQGPKLILASLFGLRRFTLTGLFSVTTSVSIVLALFRAIDVQRNDYMRIMGVAVLLALVVWMAVALAWQYRSLWRSVPATIVCAYLVGIALGWLGLPHLRLSAVALTTTIQAVWLLAGVLIYRITFQIDAKLETAAPESDPLDLADASSGAMAHATAPLMCGASWGASSGAQSGNP